MNHSRRIRARSLQNAHGAGNMVCVVAAAAAAIKHDKISPESFLVTRCYSHDLDSRSFV